MDTTKLKGLWEKIKDFFKNMSKKLRIILAAVLAVILIAIIVTVVLVNQSRGTYVQLYQNLTTQEASEVATYLQNNGFNDFQVVGGSSLMVRADQYNSLVGQLALAGYPKSGSLYGSYWDNVGMMTTTSERAIALRIASEEKLAAILRTLVGIQDAQVTITPGEDRTFVLQDNSTETTASVVLTLQNGYTALTDDNVDAIRRIVSRAWEGLTIDNVEIIDQYMNPYLGSSGASSSDAAELQRYMEQYWINRIRTAVMQLLEPVYGPGNLSVSPNVQVEVNKRYVESTSYNQPEGSYENGGLIGHEMGWYAHTQDGYELVGGVPGTTTNADIPTYVYNEGQNAEDKDTVGTSFERDNLVDETYEQVEVLAPRITNITVAVMINQDGNRNAAHTTEELSGLVAKAAGLGDMTDEEIQGRVTVLLTSFYTEEEEPAAPSLIPREILPYLIIGVAALVLLIIILIVVAIQRSKKKKKQQEEDQKIIEEQINELGGMAALGLTPEVVVDENGMPVAAPPDGGADIMEINTERSIELRQSVRQFVQNNPEVAAQMIKSWLRGDEDGE